MKKILLFIIFFGVIQTSMSQQSSVLKSGNWYKIAVTEDGIYQITYDDFQNLGINISNLEVEKIRLFGNGGGMLPNLSSEFRYNDLEENAIEIIDINGNGIFNSEDYLLFFGESANKWVYDSLNSVFDFQYHLYADQNFYYLSIDTGSSGKRISQKPTFSNFDKIITSFNDFQIHEINNENLIQSGREWYGERFGIINSYSFNFNFPNIENSSLVKIKTSVAARSLNPSSFSINANNSFISNISISNIVYDYATAYAKTNTNFSEFFSNSDQINIDINYNYTENNAIGWLNYIQLNARRNLRLNDNILHFRDIESVSNNQLGKYIISNASSQTRVWDITDPRNVNSVKLNFSSSEIEFIDSVSNLRTYYAFNNDFKKVELIGKIENQNLRALGSEIEYIIVSHPDFLSAAEELADIHRSEDGLNSIVVTPNQIYNEFSSGKQDVTAIRDFFRMLYKLPNSSFKYALLFGDGSYDNKNRLSNNSNFIPTYQSENSLNPTLSYVTDDYYALLDDDDGDFISDLLDLGVGRLPVKNISEAYDMVNKVKMYYDTESLGDWRNNITFVADDGDAKDGNLHMTQANNLANYIDTNYQNININKIYLDNYLQESTPGGPRSPDAQNAINNSVNNGSFLINYTGHGGPLGWTQERILEVDQLNLVLLLGSLF